MFNNINSNDWSLCEEYRDRKQASAAKLRMIQTQNAEAPTPRQPVTWLRQLREAFIDNEPKLTRVPLRRAYQS